MCPSSFLGFHFIQNLKIIKCLTFQKNFLKEAKEIEILKLPLYTRKL